jgi:phosphate:Na+ symporter|tara:strand:- start:35251 stop:36900 length:1650 start_codon:yes stop_codon:yes gene_type:complete
MSDIIFPFIGGIGLFLIGMMLLSEGLIAFAGPALRQGLIRFTGTPLKAFTSGALATALVQSSSATTVTIIGFVSAGLITFAQAIGFLIGASLGNTATGWIVAVLGLKINFGFYTLPLIGLGALLRLLAHGRWRDMGVAMAGFGMIFLGLSTLQEGMRDLSAMVDLSSLPMGGLGAHTVIMLIGLVMTIILQSSSAAIATTLTALYTQTINFDQAAALVVGAAIGTTVTGALVAIGATIAAKRTAYANILFNLATGLIAILLLPGFLALTHFLSQAIEVSPGTISLVLFHTLFISLGAALFLPFANQFARLVERIVPAPANDIADNLDNSLLQVPEVALEASQRSLERIANILFNSYHQALEDAPHSVPEKLLQQSQVALDRAYAFISRIPLESDNDNLAQQRIAQLHATDHLIRLRQRLLELNQLGLDLKNPQYATAIAHHKHLLSLASPLLLFAAPENRNVNSPDPDATMLGIQVEADALHAQSKQMRQTLLQGSSHNHTAVAQVLETTDTVRWLDRTGHHIARICHYLHQARRCTQSKSFRATAVKP